MCETPLPSPAAAAAAAAADDVQVQLISIVTATMTRLFTNHTAHKQEGSSDRKLAPCGTDGRFLLRAIFFQVQSHVTQKLG